MHSILTSVLLCLFFISSASAKDLGTFGAVYDIAEKDALKEFEQKARSVDFSKVVDRDALIRKAKNYSPSEVKEMKTISPAQKDRSFLVDMTYTLQRDIADEKGNIVYPAGYTFNPLQYIVYPKTLVIINGRNREQIQWFKASPYSRDITVTLLLTDGSHTDLSKSLKRPVFYANMTLLEAFRVQAVPSIIRQAGGYIVKRRGNSPPPEPR